jgi:hypothetical protein
MRDNEMSYNLIIYMEFTVFLNALRNIVNIL